MVLAIGQPEPSWIASRDLYKFAVTSLLWMSAGVQTGQGTGLVLCRCRPKNPFGGAMSRNGSAGWAVKITRQLTAALQKGK